MGFAEFITDRFIGKEICIYMTEEGESLIFDQSWVSNKIYIQGIAKEIDNNILVLEIIDVGDIYINCDEISGMWEPTFNYHKAIKTSLTKKMVGARQK